MRIVFFGTPPFVIPVLEAIHKKFLKKNGESPVVAVLTQKPKPAGRKQKPLYSAVDSWAHKKGIKIFYSAVDFLREKPQADLGVLAAYGEIIPPQVIKHFPLGILNVHPSLLPKFRGASPVQAVIASGETLTGATIIRLDELLDHGSAVVRFKENVLPTDTTGSLRERIFERSADVLSELITPYSSGKVRPKEQDHSEATFTTEVKKQDGYLSAKRIKYALGESPPTREKWTLPFLKDYSSPFTPALADCFIRAMDPWPMCWTYVSLGKRRDAGEQKDKDKNTKAQKRRLKIIKSHIEEERLVLDTVQLEGKNPVSWKDFNSGYPDFSFEEA